VRRVVQLQPNTQYVYRQTAKDFNPKEVNNAVENMYLIEPHAGAVSGVGEDDGDEAVENQALVRIEAILHLVAHLVLYSKYVTILSYKSSVSPAILIFEYTVV